MGELLISVKSDDYTLNPYYCYKHEIKLTIKTKRLQYQRRKVISNWRKSWRINRAEDMNETGFRFVKWVERYGAENLEAKVKKSRKIGSGRVKR